MFRTYPKGVRRPFILSLLLNSIETNIENNNLTDALKTMKFVLSGINVDADRMPIHHPKETTFFSKKLAAMPYARIFEVLDHLTTAMMGSSEWELCLQQAQLLQGNNRYHAGTELLKKVFLAPALESQPTEEQRHTAKMMMSVMGSSIKVEMRAALKK